MTFYEWFNGLTFAQWIGILLLAVILACWEPIKIYKS